MKYLLDTNEVAEPRAARPSAGVLAGIQAHAAELAISASSW
jgi:predicted nucleic acid-binding protein